MKSNKIFAYIATVFVFTISVFTITGQNTAKSNLTETLPTVADQWQIEAEQVDLSGEQKSRVIKYSGKVDARSGDYRIRADKLTLFEADKKIVAEGEVIFMKNEQIIDCNSLEFSFGKDNKSLIMKF